MIEALAVALTGNGGIMKYEHSAGMWHVELDFDGRYRIFDAQGEQVALCEVGYDKERKQTHANARLISRLPHLIKTLESIYLDTECYRRIPCPHCEARKAIWYATGILLPIKGQHHEPIQRQD